MRPVLSSVLHTEDSISRGTCAGTCPVVVRTRRGGRRREKPRCC